MTRLRLKDPSYLDDFFGAAVALLEQSKSSRGTLGADALADANDTWWTCTAWDSYGSMRSFVDTDLHKSTMSRLDDWCSEASFVDWEQASAQLPDWQESYRRLVADGTSADLTDATDANASRSFPPPSKTPARDRRSRGGQGTSSRRWAATLALPVRGTAAGDVGHALNAERR